MKLSDPIAKAIAAHAEKKRSFYLYDTAPMRAKIANLKNILPQGVSIYYAMKANPHAAFLGAAKEAGVTGVEIASLGEGERALAAGFRPDQLIFTGPGKSPEELRWSVTQRLRTVHLESMTEAHRLDKICGELGVKQDVLVRVNPNFDIHEAQAKFSGDSSKMGIDQNLFAEILPKILEFPNLNFLGLHVYAASGILRMADLLENCRRVFELAQKTEARHKGIICKVIDFGGGFGIDYLETGKDFSPEIYAKELQILIDEFGFKERALIIELGRYLAADSGWYCTEILDIKTSLGKKQVICAGGAHHFRRPVAIGINHPIVILPMNRPKVFEGQENVKNERVFIGGPLCNTADRLAPQDVRIEHAEIGDIAVFGLAGAYGLTMSHLEFLSHARPEEIVL